ncbi:hypothetical protein BG011_008272 [Mortierella polycephala]|uniref:Programmed cell death protein 2 C-terminal domain-containing protein n=1 Tax=Mortierella polycephala TaxID=41804 RepID=A0A9P6PP83_9FUNG|nr:hypothetical protein BG011_008272 [Mortierella polycephala]
MDKKGSGTGKKNVAKKLTEATLGLKSLQLGPTPPTKTSGKEDSNTNKNNKKSKKNTGGNNTAKSSAPPKKKSPILLGMPDSPMETHDDTDPYVTKIGGAPLWLEENQPASGKYGVCQACGKNMYLLLQAYVPLEKSPYDRVVYVWACNQRLCMRKPGSFRVVRALKLNQEYAQKLEKKVKPAAAAPVANPVIGAQAANSFPAPGAFDMGNALFGGAGSGFNNPFAPPSNTTNPFAPPPGFGVGFPAPTSTVPTAPATLTTKSFASAASSNIPEKEEPCGESGSEQNDDSVDKSTPWPEDMPTFSPHYLYITEEILDDSGAIDEISQRYSHLLALEGIANNDSNGNDDGDASQDSGASWSGEAYEKASLPKGVDKAFKKFTERVQAWPDQCVRYDFPGLPLLFSFSDPTARLLLPPSTAQHSKHTSPSAHRIPKCPACKGPRGFEFQLMPNLLSLLDVTSKRYLSVEEQKSLKDRKGAQMFDIGMEWGTILVYSCVGDCFEKSLTSGKENDDESGNANNRVRYFEEVALVQFED